MSLEMYFAGLLVIGFGILALMSHLATIGSEQVTCGECGDEVLDVLAVSRSDVSGEDVVWYCSSECEEAAGR